MRKTNDTPAIRAFEALVRPHFAAVYSQAYRILGNASDAEDLVQELCIRAFLHVDELTKLDNPRAWLMRVAYRLAIDLHRSHTRSPLRAVGIIEDLDLVSELVSDDPGPEQYADAALAHRRLASAWRFLGIEERALLMAHSVDGYSLEEMEEMTGLSIAAIKSRLHRARIRLGRLLEREERLAAEGSGGTDDELSTRRRLAG